MADYANKNLNAKGSRLDGFLKHWLKIRKPLYEPGELRKRAQIGLKAGPTQQQVPEQKTTPDGQVKTPDGKPIIKPKRDIRDWKIE